MIYREGESRMKERIINIIREVAGIDDLDINESTDLNMDFNFDSLKFINLVVQLESAFTITIPPDKLLIENFSTLPRIEKVLTELIQPDQGAGSITSIPKHVLSTSTVVLQEDGKLLLVKNPRRGWENPGGYVEQGENITESAIREVREETGLEIVINRFVGVFYEAHRFTATFLFVAECLGGTPRLSRETLEIGYYSIEEAKHMVKWDNFWNKIELALQQNNQSILIDQ